MAFQSCAQMSSQNKTKQVGKEQVNTHALYWSALTNFLFLRQHIHIIKMKGQNIFSWNSTDTREYCIKKFSHKVCFLFLFVFPYNCVNIKKCLEQSCFSLLKAMLSLIEEFMTFRSGTLLFCVWRPSVAFWVLDYFQKLLFLFMIFTIQSSISCKGGWKIPFLNKFLWVSTREMSAKRQEIISGTVMHWEWPSK